ncbi:MAG: endolytic transglycosylase MltG [Bacteroidota bacterium]
MLERSRTKKAGKIVQYSMVLVFAGIIVMIILFIGTYRKIFEPNIRSAEDYTYLYIPTGSSFEDVLGYLRSDSLIRDEKSFIWLAGRKGYKNRVLPGRYRIYRGMSNNELINMLRMGSQDPVLVVFNSVRTLGDLAGKVARYIEPDSLDLAGYFTDPGIPALYGKEAKNFTTLFIPNSYELYWTTTPEQFTRRMQKESERFWKGSRDEKARAIGLTRDEVITLASIVDEETLHNDENARVAGLYMNRLKAGIPLQADPTLKFALGDFGRRRIINSDKEIDSPYNTYKYRGLPPGPITIPSVAAIDGVLDYEKHNYLYMCARADFSGYHAFARTMEQHGQNARAYQRVLNQKRIYN